VIYTVRPLTEDFSKYFVSFEADLQAKGSVYILTNEVFVLQDISSSCITSFDMSVSILRKEPKEKISAIVREIKWKGQKILIFFKITSPLSLVLFVFFLHSFI